MGRGRGRDQFSGTLPKLRHEGERNIVLGSFVCVTRARHDELAYVYTVRMCMLYMCVRLSAGLWPRRAPLTSRFIKDPAEFSLSFFFRRFLLFV